MSEKTAKEARAHPLKAIRARAVPLVAIETADPAATVTECRRALNGKDAETAVLQWDCLNGPRGITDPGTEYAASLGEPIMMTNPAEFLKAIASDSTAAPAKALIFMHNAHLCLNPDGRPNLGVIQGIWNCRDRLKATGATLVLLGPGFTVPAELAQDLITLTEEAPTEEEIGEIVDAINKDTPGADKPEFKVDRPKVIDGLIGYLSRFAVEQSYSLSLTKNGPNIDKLWALKVQTLKSVAGLEVSRPDLSFANMAGNDGIKRLILQCLNGREKYRAILWLDEIEKALAAGGTDLSGTTQAILEQFLFWTQQRKTKGIMLCGIPGAGKSLTAQCTAAEAQCPLIRASLSTVKGGIVGQSEANMRTLLKSVDAVAQGKVLILSTCNGIDALSPEVMARLTNVAGVFFDYPTETEAAGIWRYYIGKYGLPEQPIPEVKNWVGREIESCCDKAWTWNTTLAEAAKSVVPVSTANAVKMDQLRRSVSGRFLSAATPGIFRVETQASASTGARRMTEL